jgi:hypothetical protein
VAGRMLLEAYRETIAAHGTGTQLETKLDRKAVCVRA